MEQVIVNYRKTYANTAFMRLAKPFTPRDTHATEGGVIGAVLTAASSKVVVRRDKDE